MPVNASKHGTSQLIDSQRSVVNTSAGTTRYRASSGGMACDRGSALLTCLYFSHPRDRSKLPSHWKWAACFLACLT